ncbi:hypothetical protein [Antribacter gilvus]|uniref:hypothetical protein n=1 Tax=Antribacter gilvus TaxID=2304675 RepID=UPI000F79108B|nr:hypothetical protein [Antribacter gilvus]
MSTFSDHVTGAELARESVRALVHATIRFNRPDGRGSGSDMPEHPEDTYWALGDVLAMVRSLSQVVQQIGAAHDRNAAHARVGDDPARGRTAVANVHASVRDALLALERAHHGLDTAMTQSSRITWLPPAPPPQPRSQQTPPEPSPSSHRPVTQDAPGL